MHGLKEHTPTKRPPCASHFFLLTFAVSRTLLPASRLFFRVWTPPAGNVVHFFFFFFPELCNLTLYIFPLFDCLLGFFFVQAFSLLSAQLKYKVKTKKRGCTIFIYVFCVLFSSCSKSCVEISLVVLVAAVLLYVVLVLEVCGDVIVTNV